MPAIGRANVAPRSQPRGPIRACIAPAYSRRGPNRLLFRKVTHEPLGLDDLDAFQVSGDRMAGVFGLRNVANDRLTYRPGSNHFDADLRVAGERLLIDGLTARSIAFHGCIAAGAQLHELVQHF